MNRALLAGALLGACGDPISNQVLYEDALFLGALPSPERLAPPAEIRGARVGTSAILARAVAEAAGIEGVAEVVGATGNALRDEPPDVRGQAVRRWDGVSAVVRIDGSSSELQVRGEILQPANADVLDWTIDVAPTPDGPWTRVGEGTHNADGTGSFAWEIRQHAELLGISDEVPDRLVIDYVDPARDRQRELSLDDGDVEFGGSWQVVGENFLVWFGAVELVQGGDPVPGAAQVLHLPDAGGRASGGVITADGEDPFDVCWDANGNDTWLQGGGQPTVGDDATCAVSF